MESDVDLVVLTTEKERYLTDEAWMVELGGVRIVRTQDWGTLYTERRFVTRSGLEVEFGVAPPEWASTNPPDQSIREIVARNSLRPVYDPDALILDLITACEGLTD